MDVMQALIEMDAFPPASHLAHYTLSSDRSISSASIWVHFIVLANVANTNAYEVEITDNAGVALFSLHVPEFTTVTYKVPFFADTGLKALAVSADIEITVGYSGLAT